MPQSQYRGPERRVHRTYVTRNTEYHFRADRCVAVRDLRTGQWLLGHAAVNRKLSGGVRFHDNGTAVPSFQAPGIGEALYFDDSEGGELITSALSRIQRPTKRDVSSYESLR